MGGDWGKNSGRVICLEEKGPSKDAADRLRYNKEGKPAQEQKRILV